jgi:hypothetical protein
MILTLVSITIVVYFAVLTGIPIITSKDKDTHAFFNTNRQSPWCLAAFGSIGVFNAASYCLPAAEGKSDVAIFNCIHAESSSY